ncbi:MAG: hypothetical protein IJJ19_07565 [Erysipelotrichaceae bacterium]|nr:hypothetical protein [Erysipelotrichaceae bacterium]
MLVNGEELFQKANSDRFPVLCRGQIDGHVEFVINVPANCTAEIVINGETHQVGYGSWRLCFIAWILQLLMKG